MVFNPFQIIYNWESIRFHIFCIFFITSHWLFKKCYSKYFIVFLKWRLFDTTWKDVILLSRFSYTVNSSYLHLSKAICQHDFFLRNQGQLNSQHSFLLHKQVQRVPCKKKWRKWLNFNLLHKSKLSFTCSISRLWDFFKFSFYSVSLLFKIQFRL